jgi:hypothetical protein
MVTVSSSTAISAAGMVVTTTGSLLTPNVAPAVTALFLDIFLTTYIAFLTNF